MKSYFASNKKGSALVMVILTMLILSIFGLALLNVSIAGVKHVQNSKAKTQAYYYARTGVDEVADSIIAAKSAPSSFTPNTTEAKVEIEGSSRYYMINKVDSLISLTGEDGYLIEATGNDNGIESQVSLKVVKDKPSDIFDVAVYSGQDLDIRLMQIEGDIRSGGTITYKDTGSDAYDITQYTPYPKSPIVHQYEQLPVLIPSALSGAAASTPPLSGATIATDAYFSTITVNNHESLTLNIPASGILRLLVDDLQVKKGTLNITGSGKLELYVRNFVVESGSNIIISNDSRVDILVPQAGTINFQTPITVGNDPNKLNIFMDKNCTLTLQANGEVYGYIFGPEANIIMQSNQSTIYGAVIGKVLNGNGNNPSGKIVFRLPDDSYSNSYAAYRKRIYK